MKLFLIFRDILHGVIFNCHLQTIKVFLMLEDEGTNLFTDSDNDKIVYIHFFKNILKVQTKSYVYKTFCVSIYR